MQRGQSVIPDAFLSGHAHNYQRYTRRIGGKQVPYIVAGTGGMPPQPVPDATGQPTAASHDTTYDAALSSFGSLYVAASPHRLRFEFWRLGNVHTDPFDPFTIDLTTHLLTRRLEHDPEKLQTFRTRSCSKTMT